MNVRRMVIGLLVGAMTVCASAPASAQTPWLMDYLQGWYSDPPMINAEQPTTITLWGWFPYDCGVVDNVTVVDSAHVEFALSQGPACDDTARVWHQSFALGLLPAGYHTLHVRRAFYNAGEGIPHVDEASFQFYVEADSTPPPQPPGLPDLGSYQVRCLSGWYTEPNPPTDQGPTRLVLWGWFPYYCGFVAGYGVLESDHVTVTLRRGGACGTDTARTWSQPIELGVLSKGEHVIHADVRVLDDPRDSSNVRTATFSFVVGDEPVSAAAPNPFVESVRFNVTNREAGPVRVDIYDPRGRHVTRLFEGDLPAGTHPFSWAGKREDGGRVPIGLYFSRVALDRRVITRRLVLLPR